VAASPSFATQPSGFTQTLPPSVAKFTYASKQRSALFRKDLVGKTSLEGHDLYNSQQIAEGKLRMMPEVQPSQLADKRMDVVAPVYVEMDFVTAG
jgi:hypothetical protein